MRRMVLFVDLDADAGDDRGLEQGHWAMRTRGKSWNEQSIHQDRETESIDDDGGGKGIAERENPNKGPLTEALGCYPYVYAFPRRLRMAI